MSKKSSRYNESQLMEGPIATGSHAIVTMIACMQHEREDQYGHHRIKLRGQIPRSRLGGDL
jgi:hypothetical protein